MRGAESQLTDSERAVASARSAEVKEQAENATAKAVERIAEIEAQLAAGKAGLQPKLDALAAAREAAVAAETDKARAIEAARKMARALVPISVFISRKTQRMYVLQAFQPILETSVTIQDADRPIGTHVFTAMERAIAVMRWSMVSMDGGHPDRGGGGPNRNASGRRDRDIEPTLMESQSSAIAALHRVAIPQDALDRISEMASPRSSLIISYEALSSETGKGTEFVILMSGEPQGGIKFRRRVPADVGRYQRRYDRLPYWPFPFAGNSTWFR
jgi:hypothetical protein